MESEGLTSLRKMGVTHLGFALLVLSLVVVLVCVSAQMPGKLLLFFPYFFSMNHFFFSSFFFSLCVCVCKVYLHVYFLEI